jgi:hypothetical protein
MLLTELKINNRYTEVLSGLTVLVISISARGKNNASQVRAVYFNKVSGLFSTIDVVDNQLRPFDVYPSSLEF